MNFPNGIWPTMVTPFTYDNKIDYASVERLIDWYEKRSVDGIFAVCQSSEMFFLSLEERVELATFIKKRSKLPVIASGHISDGLNDQIAEVSAMVKTGADAIILVSNRLAAADESDDVWIANLQTLLDAVPADVPLGFYECPYPYKRLLSEKALKFCVETGRFYFLKDTSCCLDNMAEKLEIIKGSKMKLYNANSSTFIESVKIGAAGFSGVMGNFHPQLYSWLFKNYSRDGGRLVKNSKVSVVDAALTMMSLIETRHYPIVAKQFLVNEGVFETIVTRTKDSSELKGFNKIEAEKLRIVTDEIDALIRS